MIFALLRAFFRKLKLNFFQSASSMAVKTTITPVHFGATSLNLAKAPAVLVTIALAPLVHMSKQIRFWHHYQNNFDLADSLKISWDHQNSANHTETHYIL